MPILTEAFSVFLDTFKKLPYASPFHQNFDFLVYVIWFKSSKIRVNMQWNTVSEATAPCLQLIFTTFVFSKVELFEIKCQALKGKLLRQFLCNHFDWNLYFHYFSRGPKVDNLLSGSNILYKDIFWNTQLGI